MDDLKLWIIIAQIINFWLLFFIFKYFLWEKIVSAIEERRKHLKASENAEDEAKEKLAEAEKEKDSILADARKKALEIEDNAENLAKQNTKKALEKGEKEANFMLSSARSQIEKEKLEMENSMKSKILDLALKLNSKIFKKDAVNKDFIESEYMNLTQN